MENKHFIHVHNPEGTGKKLLVLGGDITVSGKGFAKGVKHKQSDYVHKIIRYCVETVRDFGFCVMQSLAWEQNYKNSEDVIKLYRDGEKFKADIIIFQIGDHIEKEWFDEETFKAEFEKLVYFVDPFRRSKIVILTSFSKTVSDIGGLVLFAVIIFTVLKFSLFKKRVKKNDEE